MIPNTGHLYSFRLSEERDRFVFKEKRHMDRVADNTDRDDFVIEGEEILFGTDFSVVTDI